MDCVMDGVMDCLIKSRIEKDNSLKKI